VNRERRASVPSGRPSFSSLAREAILKHVPEARAADAWWSVANNAVWVRWTLESGSYAYLGIHRHLDWISGETGISHEPVDLGLLFPLPGVPAGPVPGWRIRLGHLIEGDDRWWPAGEDEAELIERLEWMALQLRVKGCAYFRRYATAGHTGDPPAG
jgi:hypothetical protein